MGAAGSSDGDRVSSFDDDARRRFAGIGAAAGVVTTVATGSPAAGVLVGLAAATPPDWAQK